MWGIHWCVRKSKLPSVGLCLRGLWCWQRLLPGRDSFLALSTGIMRLAWCYCCVTPGQPTDRRSFGETLILVQVTDALLRRGTGIPMVCLGQQWKPVVEIMWLNDKNRWSCSEVGSSVSVMNFTERDVEMSSVGKHPACTKYSEGERSELHKYNTSHPPSLPPAAATISRNSPHTPCLAFIPISHQVLSYALIFIMTVKHPSRYLSWDMYFVLWNII